MCGENDCSRSPAIWMAGSSPRVRGKRMAPGGFTIDHGLIPACAGKTAIEIPMFAEAAAHPRVCGENLFVSNITNRCMGSSPRVRGKLLVFVHLL